jgi:hypothetical protein
MSFVDQLLLKGVVSEATLPELVRLSNEKFDGNIERALLQNGVSDDQILEVKKGYFNMPVRRVDPKTVTFDILKYIPQESAKYYSIVPLSVSGGSLEVGVVDPENIQATDAVQFITSKLNMPYTISVISYGDFEKASIKL